MVGGTPKAIVSFPSREHRESREFRFDSPLNRACRDSPEGVMWSLLVSDLQPVLGDVSDLFEASREVRVGHCSMGPVDPFDVRVHVRLPRRNEPVLDSSFRTLVIQPAGSIVATNRIGLSTACSDLFQRSNNSADGIDVSITMRRGSRTPSSRTLNSGIGDDGTVSRPEFTGDSIS